MILFFKISESLLVTFITETNPLSTPPPTPLTPLSVTECLLTAYGRRSLKKVRQRVENHSSSENFFLPDRAASEQQPGISVAAAAAAATATAVVSFPAAVSPLVPVAELMPGWPVTEEGDGAGNALQPGLAAFVEPGHPVLERLVVVAVAAVVVVEAVKRKIPFLHIFLFQICLFSFLRHPTTYRGRGNLIDQFLLDLFIDTVAILNLSPGHPIISIEINIYSFVNNCFHW